MKKKKIVVLVLSLSMALSASLSAVLLMKNIKNNPTDTTADGNYSLLIDENNPLIGGNVYTNGGTKVHFDEYGVDETITDGVLELAAYGNVSLQTYISGISAVEVWSETGENKEFYLGAGATPNSCEFTWSSNEGHSRLNLKNGFEGNCFYFSIHNKTETPLKIEKINIEYTCEDTEASLKNLIRNHLGSPMNVTYNGHPYNPYDGYEINPDDIPADRVVVKTMKENEYPTAPGNYIYGYEVYDVDSTNHARKLLYTLTKEFDIIGYNIAPADNHKVVTFHIPDENGNEKLVFQQLGNDVHDYDLTEIPEECLEYNWISPYNDFTGIGDEHYYPVFHVTGLSANKEGDGCYPVHTSYSYLERGFKMPNPQMKAGYKFGGWYLDQELTTIFDESKMYPGNLTLYAKCIETDLDIRRVYYHQEDGELSNHVDYLYSSDEKLELPLAKSIMDLHRPLVPFYWNVRCGTNDLGLYKQPDTIYSNPGDKIRYSDFAGMEGDVHIYATEIKRLPSSYQWSYDLFSQDSDGNNIFQHTLMANINKSEYDFIIPGYAVNPRESGDGQYHDQADCFPVARTGQFFMTDEKEAYLADGGTLKTIASYAYANIEMHKPLQGILRHDNVQKVGRRAFFNRYDLKGTYFPKNATVFEIEAYANTRFNKVLTLPKGLTTIGDRCFMGAENIDFVCLPRTIKTIGANAFAFGTYNSELRVFENITNRTVGGNDPIVFLYEGSEMDFNKLDDVTKNAIRNNASRIVYNYSYEAYYGRG